MERDIPPGFDLRDDAQAAQHARIALRCNRCVSRDNVLVVHLATDDRKLFGLGRKSSSNGSCVNSTLVGSEEVISGLRQQLQRQSHRVTRVLDPALAAPRKNRCTLSRAQAAFAYRDYRMHVTLEKVVRASLSVAGPYAALIAARHLNARIAQHLKDLG